MRYKHIILVIILCLLTLSCRENSYRVKTGNIEVELDFTRLEYHLFEVSPGNLADSINVLSAEHSDFLKIFGYVINIGEIGDSSWVNGMLSFITDRQNVEVYNDVIALYHDDSWLREGMLDAWKHFRYYFPDEPVPSVYTCITGFNNSIIVGDSVIGIGLDRYLGQDCRYYPMLGIYEYLQKKMVPEKILSDCMYAWAASTWEPGDNSNNDLLDEIIREGRLLYFTRSMLPRENDTLIFGFTEGQLNFCLNNEDRMWEYLVEHDLLYSTDPFVINKLTGEAPFTSYFTGESPGRAACWIGFRIVESYMTRNRDIQLYQLMNQGNMRAILEESGYSPS